MTAPTATTAGNDPPGHSHSTVGPAAVEGGHSPTGRGSVVLDIGGTIGALILHTDVDLLGAELDVALTGGDPHAPRTHTAVRERRGGSQVQYGAIYAALPAGDYTVYDPDGRPADTVTITGGEVATLDWRHHRPTRPGPPHH